MTLAHSILTRRQSIAAELAAAPDGVLEAIAEKAGATYAEVLAALPAGQSRSLPGSAFEQIWNAIASWGPVLVIVHTGAGVFEIDTGLNPGTFGHGYFNIHGSEPLHGHLNAGRCAAIHFVDRPLFGRRSCSVQFIDEEGQCMFKIFVKRDKAREMLADQLEKFIALPDRILPSRPADA